MIKGNVAEAHPYKRCRTRNRMCQRAHHFQGYFEEKESERKKGMKSKGQHGEALFSSDRKYHGSYLKTLEITAVSCGCLQLQPFPTAPIFLATTYYQCRLTRWAESSRILWLLSRYNLLSPPPSPMETVSTTYPSSPLFLSFSLSLSI